MKQYDITVNSEQTGDQARLDKFIVSQKTEWSRGLVRQLIERGGVYLNGKRCKVASRHVQKGDTVRIYQPENTKRDPILIRPEQIIFENQDWLVVNKPPFIPTHATLDNSREHLVQALQDFIGTRDKRDPKQVYMGVHHRLDRDTSGVLLFTKRKEANAAVAKAFQTREVSKIYLAVVVGQPKADHFVVKSHLGRDPRNKRRFCSVQSGGDYAETEVRKLMTREVAGHKLTLLEVRPLTGRTHQIRVHLSEQGLPMAGDDTYGKQLSGVKRLLLHAWKLSLLGRQWCAPLPEEFTRLDFTEPTA